MARFTIYSPTGTALYTGTPTFTGQYMKPGLLEFREVALALFVELVPGCYVDYSRTGHRYKIYTAPQLKKQARSASYGGAFVYQSVQLYDASKMLEYCPFRDLVMGDNRIHFSTQPSISTFEGCDGLARRFEACLRDQYDVNGVQSWAVRIATRSENPGLYDLMMEPREFTVSGVNILECLEKIYEIWPEVGWIYKVENGIDTIVIGGGGLSPNVGTYAYGKGNGLTSLTRIVANADEIANRIFAYGSSRNMLPRWYNNKPIKNAESVDIQNLMIPISEWGLTDGLPDAAKAFVENAQSIAKNGLRPATIYFDGTGEYPAIYPSIRETTIGMVRTAIGDSTAKYYPSTSVYTNASERIDKLLAAQASFDSGLPGDATGRANYGSQYESINVSTSTTFPANTLSAPVYNYQGTYKPPQSGNFSLSFGLNFNGEITMMGMKRINIAVTIRRPEYQGAIIFSDSREIESEPGSNSVQLTNIEFTSAKVPLDASTTYNVFITIVVVADASSSGRTCNVLIAGGIVKSIANYRSNTFEVKLRQVGFDINEQAVLGEGKTIAMRTGKCAGRSFTIKSVQYDSATDSWTLECWRSEDESLSQWFPNADYPVRGKETNYDGDEFVLLDIAMPDIYISMAEQKLLAAAQELLADTAVERWQYSPEIDAKFMVENNRTIRAGEYLTLNDADVIGANPVSIIVDTININEGESAIPTYKVTLRDRKKKTWTESESVTMTPSKSVGNASYRQEATTTAIRDSFFEEKVDPSDNTKTYVWLKDEYVGLGALGWMSGGGIGNNQSGGGGVIDTVWGAEKLGTIYSPSASEDLTETFSAYAIDKVWQAVLGLQQSTPNVSLVNGGTNSTLTVNGTVADFYTKAQVDNLLVGIHSFEPTPVQTLPAASSSTMFKLYLVPSSDPQTQNIKDEYITVYDGTNYSWEKIGSTAIDLTGYATQAWVQQQGYLTSFTETDPTVSAWAKAANKPSYAFSEITNKPTTISGYGITDAVMTTGDQSIGGNKTFTDTIFAGHIMGIASSALTLGNPQNVSQVKIVEDTSIYDVTIRGMQVINDTPQVKWSIAETGAASFTSLSVGGNSVTPNNYVTLDGAQTITGVKTFSGGITMSGANIVPATHDTCTVGTSSNRFSEGMFRNLHATTFDFRDGDAPGTQLGKIYCNGGVMQLQLGSEGSNGIFNFGSTTGLFHSGNGAVPCGRSDHRWSGLFANQADIRGGVILRDGTSGNKTAYIVGTDGYLTLRAGSNIDSSYTSVILHQTYGLIPGASGSATLGYGNSAGRWSAIYGVNGDFSGDILLSTNAKGIYGTDTNGGAVHLMTLADNNGLYLGTSALTRVQISATGHILAYWGSNNAYIICGASEDVWTPTIQPNSTGKNLGVSGNRWSNIYGVNADLTGDLALSQSSHIDIGPLRIEYDATNKALHITKKDSNDTNTYGLYADGFVSAGGVGQA